MRIFTFPLTTLNLSCIQIDDVNLFTSKRGGEGFCGKKRETWKERRRFENKNIGKERRETVNGRCVCVCVCMYVNRR